MYNYGGDSLESVANDESTRSKNRESLRTKVYRECSFSNSKIARYGLTPYADQITEIRLQRSEDRDTEHKDNWAKRLALTDNPESDEVVAVRGRFVAAERRPAEDRMEVPATAARHAMRAGGSALRIVLG